MKYVFDTNAVINFLANKGNFDKLSVHDVFYISFITYIELKLGYKTEFEKKLTEEFIENLNVIMINEQIIRQTIEIRKNKHIKLPDAIIVASSIEENAVLITSDTALIQSGKNLIDFFNPLESKQDFV